MPDDVRVLLIDDDEDDFLLCRDMLEEVPSKRYALTWASAPDAAREALGRDAFDVILLDHYLGSVTGVELLPEMRERSGSPVVMLTGLGSHEVDTAAIRAGASDYLVKRDLTPGALERSIRHAIERDQMQRALQASEERYRTMVMALQEGILVLDDDGRILTSNPGAEELLGLDAEQLTGSDGLTPQLELLKEDGSTLPPEERPYAVTLRTRRGLSGIVVGVRRPDETVIWLNMNTQPLAPSGKGWPKAVLVSFVDISDSLHAKNVLTHRAFHDPLTDLPNRALFADRLEQVLTKAQRKSEVVAVGMVDLDRFKTVNDTMGHAAGDELLRGIAQRLKASLRGGDMVARLGGDEFTLLLRDVGGQDGAEVVAQRVIDAFQPPFQIEGQAVQVSVSLGVALAPRHGDTPQTLLKAADRAAYQAKAAGRNSFALASENSSGAKED